MAGLVRARFAFLAGSLLLPLPVSAQAVSDGAGVPLTVRNCGQEVTFAAPPARIVAIKSTAAELVLALGAGDRLVGTGFLDAPLPEGSPEVPVLSERMPATEVVLGVVPDLVYAGWESAFTGEAAGERATLAGFGIASYVAPAACRSEPPPALTFDAVFAEIAEMGRILGAEPQAEALIAAQRQILAEVLSRRTQPDPAPPARAAPKAGSDGAASADPAPPLTALWWSSGTKLPYVGAGSGAPQMMLAALGLENIFATQPEGWISASWEAVIAADPDVIVLVDSDWNSAAQKRRFLAENPLTSGLRAVRSESYLVIAFPAAEAGVRSVPALADLAEQLSALGMSSPDARLAP